MGADSGRWMQDVRAFVDARLRSFFEAEREAAVALAPEARELVEAIEVLTLRGGKRLRPAVCVAAFSAVDPARPIEDLADPSAALELLQSYLLIHDDWMDEDEERRGGPAVHAALRDRHGDAHLGASLAILAGDLASALSWKLLVQAPGWPQARMARAVEVFLTMQTEVVYGQQLDLLGSERVSVMQQLKTGSYTVRGPLRLGAVLADASEAQLAALEAFGQPLGEAFQLRDDLLGTFGDPRATGKPAGNDLRSGKRTSLVRAAEELLSPADRATLTAVLGRADASDAAIAEAAQLLADRGVKAAVEGTMAALLEQAAGAIEGAEFASPGRERLRALVDLLTVRDR